MRRTKQICQRTQEEFWLRWPLRVEVDWHIFSTRGSGWNGETIRTVGKRLKKMEMDGGRARTRTADLLRVKQAL